MRVLRHYRNVEAAARGAVAAIGNFDGLHRGHAAVIADAGRLARETGAPWAALTFEPHPRHFFGRDMRPFRLTPFRVKAQLLAEMGLDYLFNLRFDAGMAGLPAEDFVLQVLLGGLGVRHVVVGPGFVFGKGRLGNVGLLRDMAAQEGFGFTEIEAIRFGGARCSSTDVRGLIRRGLVDEAAGLIGRLWEIEGRVEAGAARGLALGFPTANLALDNVLHPAPGIYAVRVKIEGANGVEWRDGAAYIGASPTFAGESLALEVHLLDFDGEIYGRRLRVAFVKRVRKDETFDSAESLTAQMVLDCRRVRQILADSPTETRSADPFAPPPAA